MPVLDLTAKGELRWDANGVLLATILFPDDPELRIGFEARWRAEHKAQIPASGRLFRKTSHEPAKRFCAEPSIRRKVRRRARQVERIGPLLWLQAAHSITPRADATENRAGYANAEVAPVS